jgi:hypothetical protein
VTVVVILGDNGGGGDVGSVCLNVELAILARDVNGNAMLDVCYELVNCKLMLICPEKFGFAFGFLLLFEQCENRSNNLAKIWNETSVKGHAINDEACFLQIFGLLEISVRSNFGFWDGKLVFGPDETKEL